MSEKKKMNKEIQIRGDAIAAEREQEVIILANLGQSVFDSGSANGKPLKKQHSAVKKISDDILGLEESLRKLLADDEKRTSLQEEQKALKVELRNIKNKEEPLFEELGRSGWDLWNSGRDIHEGMEEALDDLIKAEVRLHAAEDAVFRTEKETGNKAVRLLTKGKAFLLAGRRKSASTALDRLWIPVGEKLYRGISAEAFSDTSAAVSFSALDALNQRRDEISDRVIVLTNETDVLDTSLEELPGKGGVKKRMNLIETSLEKKHNQLETVFMELGRLWIDKTDGKPSDAVVEKRKREWVAVNHRISVLEEEQKAFTAHIEYLESEELRMEKAGQITTLEEEIKSRQSTLKVLKKAMTGIEKRQADQKEKLPVLPGNDQT